MSTSAAKQSSQRQSRKDSPQHVIIRASAGTGKTFRLTNQYLRQLFDGAAPEQILATTFTRKAAGEILERNMVRLAAAALDEKECQTLAEHLSLPELTCTDCLALLRDLTQGLHRVRICTLDSFFSSVASSFGFEMGLPPDWSILDEIEGAQLKSRAVENVLRSDAPNDSEAAASIVQLMHLLTKGETTRSVGRLIRTVVDSLYPVFQETTVDAWTAFPKGNLLSAKALERTIRDLADAELPKHKTFEKSHASDVRSALAGDWESFIKGGIAGKVAAGENTFARKPIPEDLLTAYRQLIAHAGAVLVDSVARQTEATFRLLSRYDVRYSQLKDESRVLQFGDVTRLLADMARDGDIERLGFRMDGTISHVLLDEFQDTSLAQWQVIRPFAEAVTKTTRGTSFFCVGDIKQAIYGWRGGVAEIFDAIEDQLPGLHREELNKSFRSAPVVVETTNRIFNNLKSVSGFDDAPGIQEWCAAFSDHTTAREELRGYASLESAPAAEEGADQVETTLQHAASRIAELTERAPLASTGVLVRKNRHVSRMIFELRRLGVAASEEGGNPVNDSVAVQLILSVLKLADHPGNTAARFHVARSPLAGMLRFERYYDNERADRLARELRYRLQAEGYGPVIQQFADQLREYCEQRGKRRLAQLVELAWRWQSHATLRTTDFLEFIEQESVPDPTADRVRVMTVHQSKGLEFDIVVLPDLEDKLIGMPGSFVVRRPSPTEPIDRVCRYRNADIRQQLPPDFQQMFDDARARRISESLCVLYVAVTRARHALHMFIAPSADKEKKLPATMSGLLRAALTESGPATPGERLFEAGLIDWYDSGAAATSASESASADQGESPDTGPFKPSLPSVITFKSMTAGRKRGLQRRAPSKHESTGRIRLASVVRHGSSAATERGTLIHAWFELIEWLDERPAPTNKVLAAKAAEINSRVKNVPGLIREFRRMLKHPEILEGLSRNSWLSANASNLPDEIRSRLTDAGAGGIRLEVKNEHPFAVLEGSEVVNGFIDRLVLAYVDDQPVAAEIVDYKTDTFDFSDEPLFRAKIAHYREQLQIYTRVVARLYRIPAEAVTAQLFMLGPGRVVRI